MPLQGGIVAQRQCFELKVLEITGHYYDQRRVGYNFSGEEKAMEPDDAS